MLSDEFLSHEEMLDGRGSLISFSVQLCPSIHSNGFADSSLAVIKLEQRSDWQSTR